MIGLYTSVPCVSLAACRAIPLRRVGRLGIALYSTSSTSTSAVGSSPFNILFFGTDDFALAILRKIHERTHLYRAIHVVTPPDAPKKWKRATRIVETPPVKQFALQHNLPHVAVSDVDELQLDAPFSDPVPSPSNVLITASFGHLITPHVLRHFLPTHALNVHPSLLPQLRGSAPIQWAIAKRLQQTGVSVQTLGATFDTGDVLAQETFAVPPSAAYSPLRQSLQDVASSLLVDTLERFPQRIEGAWSQDEGRNGLTKSFAPRLQRKHAMVRWPAWDAATIEARHRAFHYLFPLTTAFVPHPDAPDTREARLLDVELASSVSDEVSSRLQIKAPGSAVYDPTSRKLICKCANEDGALLPALQINTIQTVGRKSLSSEEWIKGYGDPQQRLREITFVNASHGQTA